MCQWLVWSADFGIKFNHLEVNFFAYFEIWPCHSYGEVSWTWTTLFGIKKYSCRSSANFSIARTWLTYFFFFNDVMIWLGCVTGGWIINLLHRVMGSLFSQLMMVKENYMYQELLTIIEIQKRKMVVNRTFF